MAENKRKRSPKKHTSRILRFPEVKGKIVERIEISMVSEDCAIGILFQDRTYLSFNLDPFLWITPDYSDWKTGNYKPLKRWAPIQSS